MKNIQVQPPKVKPTFKVDLEVISLLLKGPTDIINRIKQEKESLKTLDPDLLVHRDDDFICSVCLMLVKDPTSCKSCSEIFCKACVRQMASNACPTCRDPQIKQSIDEKFHRKLLFQLNELELKCTNCSKTYKN